MGNKDTKIEIALRKKLMLATITRIRESRLRAIANRGKTKRLRSPETVVVMKIKAAERRERRFKRNIITEVFKVKNYNGF